MSMPLLEGEKLLFEIMGFEEDRYLYLQLKQNTFSKKNEGVVFKIKFQHMNTRKEIRLAELLNRYMIWDQ